MRIFVLAALLTSMVLTGRVSAQVGGLDRAQAVGRFLNGALPPKTPRPSTGGWRLANAFPNLTFIDPVQMLPVPYSNRLLVLEKSGRLVVFDNNETATTKTVLFDIRSKVESQHDSGMVGLALHPDFGVVDSPNRHYLYVYYRYTPQKSDTDRAYCRLSRFTWNPATSSIATASEFILINQYDRHNWHNGGGLFFGTDRFLYLSIGDEGGSNDQYNTTQKRNVGLLAGVLRIDVDRDPTRSHAIRRQPLNPTIPPSGWPGSYSQGYFIPNDNPWQSPDGTQLEEFFAVGTRSPHRMTQDRVTGNIWLGDVGQGTQEEVSKVVRGGNLQWPYREGGVAGPKSKPSPLIGFDVTPVHAYGRGTGTCVIGGYVYRGALHPELSGKYIFGDHGSGRIWSLDDSSGTAVVTSLLTMSSHGPGPKNGMGSFGLDASGEIHVLSLAGTDLDGGRIYRLEKTTEGVPEPPQLLSQTSAFSDLADLTPGPGVMPYDVIQPLWSDGSDKQRWIAIPNDGTPSTADEKIAWSEEGNWSFPIGTVLIKHFEVPGRRLETRFFLKGEDSVWFGFTYRWRGDGSDAELLPGAPVDETFTVNGTTRTWHFPGRSECSSCHTDAAGKVLGVKARHLNSDYFYATTGRTANQLVTLNRLGFFSPAIDESRLPGILTSRRQNDTTASLERRARSYLDVNCSHCHQPAAPTQSFFDARLETVPWFQNLINAAPNNNLGIAGAALVKPGNFDLSVIHRRVGSLAPGVAMPPIAKNLVDTAGLQLLNNWIASLDPAIGPGGRVTGTSPRDHTAPVLTLSRTSGTGPVNGPFSVSLSASEAILGVTASDFLVTNGTISNLTGSGQSWSFTVHPAIAGAGTISMASDRVTDIHGNANPPANVSLTFSHAPSSDLLTGGNFENGLGGWDNGGGVIITSAARSGAGAASVGAATFLVRTIPVTELQNHVYTGWISATTPGVVAKAGLSFWDANGVWIDDRVRVLQPGSTWERFEIAFTAPIAAKTVSAWILTDGSGGVAVDDLSIGSGSVGEPRPRFGPGFTNLLENSGFEAGIPPWDTGGSATISTVAKAGTKAARLGAESFFVVTKASTPGEKLALSGAYFSEGSSERIEVGFSFWNAAGVPITDRTLVLPGSANYSLFLVDTTVPEGTATVTIWAWCGKGGSATFDDLALFRPDETPVVNPANLLTNGNFESGSLSPWDTGGTTVSLTSGSRSGTAAAQIGSDSFLVHNRSVAGGETFTFTGFYRTGAASAPREAGFSFWSSTGAWLGDSLTTLNPSTPYQSFTVEGTTPVGAVACSVWVWSGANAGIVVDDLRLDRLVAAPLTPGSPEEAALAGEMTSLSLKSSRTLDLSSDGIRRKETSIGSSNPVYSDDWSIANDGVARTRSLATGERQSLVTTVSGPGIVAARWKQNLAGFGSLTMHIDGKEAANGSGGTDWKSVAATILGEGLHTVEFRFEPAEGGDSAEASVKDFRFLEGSPQLQPDLAVASEWGKPSGSGRFNANGVGQSARIVEWGKNRALFRIQWKNAAAIADGVALSGPTATPYHRLAYYEISRGRKNITASVATGSFESAEASTGAGARYEVDVRKTGRLRVARFTGILRATSLLDPSKVDGVQVRTIHH